MRKIKRLLTIILALSILFTAIPATTAEAAKTPKLSVDKIPEIKWLNKTNFGEGKGYSLKNAPTIKRDKDGILHLTIHDNTLVAVKFNVPKGYFVTTKYNRYVDVGTNESGVYNTKEERKLAGNYLLITPRSIKERTVCLKVMLIKLPNQEKSLGNTIKIRVTIKDEIEQAVYDKQAEKDFIKALNDYRVNELGIDPVKQTTACQAVAEIRAKELYTYAFSHGSPTHANTSYNETITMVGGTGKNSWEAFKNSTKGHREILSAEGCLEFGVAIYRVGSKTYCCALIYSEAEDWGVPIEDSITP